MKKLYFLILLILISISPLTFAAIQSDFAKKFQALIDKDREKYRIPGVQVSVILPGEKNPRNFTSGTTIINGKTPVNSNHVFQIGSETKSFIAVTILLLEAEGKLSIDDSIDKYLPNLPPAWQSIKIRELLNHSSKLFNYTNSDEFWDEFSGSNFQKFWSSNELLKFAVNQPFCDGWCYSNTNYILAGMIIEAVTGNSVEKALQSRIFNRLGFTRTYYLPVSNQLVYKNLVHGYSKRQLFPEEPADISDFNMSWAQSAGSIYSNSHDTALWMKKLFSGKVLPKKQLEEFKTIVDTGEGDFYGLGISYDKGEDGLQQNAWFHNGGTLGYSSWMIWLMQNDIVLTLIISDSNPNWDNEKGYMDVNAMLVDLIRFLTTTDNSKQDNTKIELLNHLMKTRK